MHSSVRVLCVEPLYIEPTTIIGNQINEVMRVAIIADSRVWF